MLNKANILRVIPLVLVFGMLVFGFFYVTGVGDILKTRETGAAPAAVPVLKTSTIRVNCQSGQRCRVTWNQQRGWGWVQASGPGAKSRVIRVNCAGPRYGWCEYSRTFPRPAAGKRWVFVELNTESGHSWKNTR
jgi:hypothetical protein